MIILINSKLQLNSDLPIEYQNFSIFENGLKRRNLEFDKFLKDSNAFFIDIDGHYYYGQIVEVCGLRAIIHGSSVPEIEWHKYPKDFINIKKMALELKCNFIQATVRPEYLKNFTLPKNFYAINWIYSLNLLNFNGDYENSELSPANFMNESKLENMAAKEYFTRMKFPGTTYYKKDTFLEILNEYRQYQKYAQMGVCHAIEHINFPDDIFILWIQNHLQKTGIISFVWVDEKFHGNKMGSNLLKFVASDLKKNGIHTLYYFVSAQNFPALSMVKKNNFTIDSLVINQQLTS